MATIFNKSGRPTHYWPMDNAHVSGTSVTDTFSTLAGTSSGAGVSSTSGPTAWLAQGRAFDGSSRISLSSCPVVLTSAFSVFFWAKLTSVSTDGSGGSAPSFLDFDIDGSNFLRILNQSASPGSVVVILVVGGVDNSLTVPGGTLQNNVWAHIGVTYSGTLDFFAVNTNRRLYINGSFVSATSDGGYSGHNAGNVYAIGGRDAGLGEITGSLAGLTIFDRMISDTEAATLYNSGVGDRLAVSVKTVFANNRLNLR